MTIVNGVECPGEQCSDHNLSASPSSSSLIVFQNIAWYSMARGQVTRRLPNCLTYIALALTPESSKGFCQQGVFRLIQIRITLE